MKQIDLTGVVLNPAAGTLDFSGVNIDPRTVLAVLHEPTNQFIYAVGRRGLGRKAINGQILTLAFNTKLLSAGPIIGFRDDGVDVASDVRLEACRALLATGNATLSNVATGIGTPADAAPGSDAGAGSLIAKVTRLLLTQSGIATVLAALRDRLPAALVGGRLSVDGSGVTQPISAAALPLPAGAATAAKQDAAAATLTSILAAFAQLAADTSVQAGTAKAEAIRALLAGTLNVALQAGSAVIGRVGLQVGGADVAAANPLPTQERAAQGAIALTAGGAVVAPGRLFAVVATAAGNVAVVFADGSTLTVPVTPGFQAFPFAVKQVSVAGTTATATYANLI